MTAGGVSRGPDHEVRVLIVGGGIVGLSAAAFLAARGVPALLVERRPAALAHPRARVINPRTVELYRQIGLEEAIQAARSRAYYSAGLVIRAQTLSATERVTDEMQAAPAQGRGTPGTRSGHVSPATWIPIDQDELERLVRGRAVELGADVRFGAELSSFEPGPDGVLATVRDRATGEIRTVRADYLIAADGHRSGIRGQLGIGLAGPGALNHILCFVFEADLSEPLRGRHLAVGHFDRPRPGTSIISDREGRWVLSLPYRPEAESLDSFTRQRCAELARAAVGVPGLELSLVSQLGEQVVLLSYEVSAQVAERFADGRVFLAGDAAHAMPPAGAFGAGTGIQDAHNLAWKLAAVLHGAAGPQLLASYDAERRPVATFTVAQSLHLLRERTGRDVTFRGGGPQVGYEQVLFGYRYLRGALAAEPGHRGQGSEPSVPLAALDGAPGTRAPHITLERAGHELSAIDLYGNRLVLLCGPDGSAWAAAMARLGEESGWPADVYQMGADLLDPAGQVPGRYGIGAAGASLIRPDGFVAWRASGAPRRDPVRELRQALARCLLWPAAPPAAPPADLPEDAAAAATSWPAALAELR